MRDCALIRTEWRDPVGVLGAQGGDALVLGLLSGGDRRARWSYVARDPDAQVVIEAGDPRDPFIVLADMIGPPVPSAADGPPFQGGVAGLCAYELGARAEGMSLERRQGFPDAVFARYPAILAFDHHQGEIIAVGRGEGDAAARTQAERALSWLARTAPPVTAGPLACAFVSTDGDAYEAAVADVVARIGAGEIFQANIARRWTGRLSPGAGPFDVARALAATSPAPFAAYFTLPGAAIVSNSPERFVRIVQRDGRRMVQSQPIKGTAPRGAAPAEDAALASGLAASPKDRAENLMIVDLMRNDLSRVCRPGSVTAPELFAVETYANVHHLVSTVEGELEPAAGAGQLLAATFPPGSITGAPKVQAMKVIAHHEPPRGPFFGSIFWAGSDGAFDANVLIRTIAFSQDALGWAIEARAGGGVVADSDPAAERAETEAKIDAVRRALTGPGL